MYKKMNIDIVQITCCDEVCGIPFWVDEKYQARLLSSKRDFYCPNGHVQAYQGESDKAKIARLVQEKGQLIREKTNLETTIKDLSKPKKRGRPRKAK